MTNNKVLAASLSFAVMLSASHLIAKTTFLPDWQETGLSTGSSSDFNRDESFCATAQKADGKLMYHKAYGCENPKIFDEYCIHSDEWISECYCPPEYNLACKAPLRGFSRFSCDGLWSACCNTTCPSGTSPNNPGGCGGSTRNDCGDTCYYPYQPCCTPAGNETGCSCGTYTCSDGCGGSRKCCSSCPDPEPEESSSSSSNSSDSSGSSNSSNSSGSSNSDPCAGTSCPSAKTCSSGCKTYSSKTSCCSSVCTECEASDPCAGTTCPTAKTCSFGCKTNSTKTDCCASVCTECKDDPCAGTTCPTEKTCSYGCASYSTTSTCCPTKVCTDCKACVPDYGDPEFQDPGCNCSPCIKKDYSDDGCGGKLKLRCRLYQPIANCSCS